ncbi:MAG: hypothetical protein EBZ59_04115 [Planctomycetia bacterium]|nr:hypothetical protein [Planctomycetia bacterium]
MGNWLPALYRLRAAGHAVQGLFFPHLPDPDHRGLDGLGLEQRASIPIADSLRRIDPNASRSLAEQGRSILRDDPPDALLLTTCHAGPEAALASVLFATHRRPLLVGCQHGFVQNWDVYWQNFCFDHFLVFGDRFRRQAPPAIRDRVHVAGLPRLERPPAGRSRSAFFDDRRPILFAAQTKCPPELPPMLQELATLAGREVLVRPHPEFPGLFAGSGLTPAPANRSLADQLAHVSLLVTTGSTAAIEALAAGCPVVVLPLEGGEHYRDAGIVTAAISASETLAVALGQADPAARRMIESFLADHLGDTDAASRAARLIESLVLSAPQH